MAADTARVQDLLDTAAPLGPAGRAQFLADACREDDALRREVESLLAALDGAPDLLTVSPVRFSAAAGGGGERPGDTVSHYTLVEQIGQGGFGTVYRAEQTAPVRRTVAVKVIKPGMDSRQVIARFEAERQALALMDHPNIARVFDAGTTANGRPYFAMELVHGPPITTYCDERGAGTRERLRLFARVCRAVQHAHQKGVIHRDLKPSNVLVALLDGQPVPKVIDFGIAKATAASAHRLTERTLLTELHNLVGTPQYMSPEQANGTAADVDTRSDVYSLGVLLYELLTGTTPFEPAALRDRSLAEVQRVIREVEPPRPSVRLTNLACDSEDDGGQTRRADRRQLSRSLRGDLDWIVMRCLEKDPARRYPSAGDVAADVERHLAGEPVSAGPPSGVYRMRKLARRHKVLIATATAVAAALVIGSSLALYGMVRATRARSNEARERQVAAAVSRVLQDMLSSVDPDLGQGREVLVRQVLDEAAKKLDGGSLRDQPAVEAAIRATVGRSYVALGRFAQAEPQLRKALDVRRRVLGPEHLDVAESLYDLGTALQMKRDDAGALAVYRESIAMSRRLLPPGDSTLARRLINYGIVLGWADDYASAEAVLREAMELNRRLGADADVAKCVHCLGGVSARKGDLATAADQLREAITLYRRALGPEHRQVAIALGQLGTTLSNLGDPAGAEPLLREQIAMGEKLLGAAHPHVTGARRGLADALERQGRWDEAVNVRGAAIAAEVGQLTQALANDPADLVSLVHRAEAYAEWGRVDEAVADFDRAIALQPRRASLLAARGDAHARVGRFREALADLTAALDLDPDEHMRWAYAAALTAYLGDETRYRAICAAMTRRFGQRPQRPEVAERTAKASMLLPGAIAPGDAVRLADHALAGAGDVPADYLPWFRVTKGMAEYRAGHWAAAVRFLTEGRDSYKPAQVGRNFSLATASADLFLAMAHHHLGDTAAARAALARAAERIDADRPPGPGAFYRADYQHWLVCQTVRREAEQTIGHPGRAPAD